MLGPLSTIPTALAASHILSDAWKSLQESGGQVLETTPWYIENVVLCCDPFVLLEVCMTNKCTSHVV